jgi:hypothetical protein
MPSGQEWDDLRKRMKMAFGEENAALIEELIQACIDEHERLYQHEYERDYR